MNTYKSVDFVHTVVELHIFDTIGNCIDFFKISRHMYGHLQPIPNVARYSEEGYTLYMRLAHLNITAQITAISNPDTV